MSVLTKEEEINQRIALLENKVEAQYEAITHIKDSLRLITDILKKYNHNDEKA